MTLTVYMVDGLRKRHWDRAICDSCPHRFSCYSDNVIYVQPSEIEESKKEVILTYIVPKCIRLGLLKNINDLWGYWGKSFGQQGSGWYTELGVEPSYCWVRFPNMVMVSVHSDSRSLR